MKVGVTLPGLWLVDVGLVDVGASTSCMAGRCFARALKLGIYCLVLCFFFVGKICFQAKWPISAGT